MFEEIFNDIESDNEPKWFIGMASQLEGSPEHKAEVMNGLLTNQEIAAMMSSVGAVLEEFQGENEDDPTDLYVEGMIDLLQGVLGKLMLTTGISPDDEFDDDSSGNSKWELN